MAKCNLTPGDVLARLQEYDALLDELLGRLNHASDTNSHWAREQLHFCVVLSLNNAYYQVREAETQAFQRVLSLELESRDLKQLYESFIAGPWPTSARRNRRDCFCWTRRVRL